MQAVHVANKLRALGFEVLRHEEGTEEADGAVYLTERVHVQIPTFGGGLTVVVEHGEGDDVAFEFYPEIHASVSALLPDLRAALAANPAT